MNEWMNETTSIYLWKTDNNNKMQTTDLTSQQLFSMCYCDADTWYTCISCGISKQSSLSLAYETMTTLNIDFFLFCIRDTWMGVLNSRLSFTFLIFVKRRKMPLTFTKRKRQVHSMHSSFVFWISNRIMKIGNFNFAIIYWASSRSCLQKAADEYTNRME